ncbi:MAG: UbiA family prenyltransferase, partial [Holophaga sp.]|nr:UbiA family prenyltransferase [Holophaga sp.]
QLKKSLLVAQTTFTVQNFDEIAEYLRGRAGEIVVENTICEDTWRRQAEARELAAKVGAVVIVGGKNSANTRHLAELAHEYGKPCQFVETAAELDLGGFQGIGTVGVLAGASTPTWLVEEVVAALEQLSHGPRRFARLFKNGFAVPFRLALGAALMSLGVHAWMGIPKTWEYPAITAAYVFCMFMLAPFVDPMGVGARGPARARVLEHHHNLLVGTGLVSLVISLGLALRQGIGSFLVVAIASAFGLAYKRQLKVGNFNLSLAAIPGSKDVLVSLALAIVAVALPMWHHDSVWGLRAWIGIGFVTSLVFARTSIRNIQDMQNDQIQGKETLPMLLGRSVTKKVLVGVLALALLTAVWMTLQMGLRHPGLALTVLAASAAYPLAHLWFLHERFTTGQRSFNPPLELSFYLMGLLALV